ncbi:trypsin-like serine protease [Lentzea sp. NPDC003310]|uniref:trypsin-like serine protease n=1 Tax=Lentzea sp. NPDC003310 TaxID=3154447 RepID=UPI0033BF7372
MSRVRRRWKACVAGVAVAAAATLLPGSAAGLSGGTVVSGGQFGFLTRVVHAGGACSGALVDRLWVITAASCFPATPQGGVPASPVKVTLGAVDLARGAGTTADVVELVRRGDRDVMLARLAAPVVDVTPVPLATSAPVAGQALQVGGFGRTATEWVPDKPRIAEFAVNAVDALRIMTTGANGVDTCKGDAGGPALRTVGGVVELAGVNTTSWQHGCLAVTETRQGSTHVRTDDIATWVRDTAATTATADPTPVSFGEDVHVFAVGADRQVHQKVLRRGQGWTGWTPLGGDLTGPVAAFVRGQELHLFGSGADGHLWHRAFVSGAWSAWEDLGGSATGRPAVIEYENGLHVFVRTAAGRLAQKKYEQSWSSWVDLEGGISGNPAALRFRGSLYVYSRGEPSGHVFQKAFHPTLGWRPWEDLGGVVSGSVTAVEYGGAIYLHGRGKPSGHVFQKVHVPDQGWREWEDLGGVVSDSPSVTTYAGSLQIYARGEPSGHLFQKAYDPSSGWFQWSDVGGDLTGSPAVTVNADASLHVYARDKSTGHVVQKPYVFGGDWLPWADLGAMHGVVLR